MPDEPIPVRLSHLLRYCAVGAVVRGPDYLVTVQDTNAWNCGPDQEIKYVEQVRAALGIGKLLRSPPTARVEDGKLTGCPIPATRFPGWMRCSRCGLLHHQPWKRASTEGSERPIPAARHYVVLRRGRKGTGRVGEDWSRRRGSWPTPAAISRTCPGTGWRTPGVGIRPGVSAARTGSAPI